MVDLSLIAEALSHRTRLGAIGILARRGEAGAPSGEIAKELGTPPTTISAHLSVLVRAGLATAERRGTSIIYRANPEALRSYVADLSKLLVTPQGGAG